MARQTGPRLLLLLLLLAACSALGVEAAQVSAQDAAGAEGGVFYDVGRRELRDRSTTCDDGLLEYISGNKVDEPLIPYSEGCIVKYQEQGHKLALPPTVAVHMTGLPKTGTTWTEVFVGKMLESICNSGIYKGCKYDLTYRGSMATIPSGPHHAGKVIRFNTFLKHDPMYDWDCEGFNKTSGKSKTGCHLYKFQDCETNIPEWEECIFRTPFKDIAQCIPDFMQVQTDLPVMDGKATLLSEQKHTEVDLDGAIRKYLHIIRDPRDAALSWVHYHKINDPKEVDEKVRAACDHYVAWTAFFYHWQMERYGAFYPSMELFYRRLMDDALSEYTKVLQWFGLRAPTSLIKKVVAETDMGAMKRMEEQRSLPGRNHAGKADAKVRKGGYGNFRDELSQDTIDYCTQAMQRMLPDNLLQVFDVQPSRAQGDL